MIVVDWVVGALMALSVAALIGWVGSSFIMSVFGLVVGVLLFGVIWAWLAYPGV